MSFSTHGTRFDRLASITPIALVVFAMGCEDGTRGKLHDPISAPEPRHPAMEAGVRVDDGGGRSAMPANHPPIGGHGDAASPHAAPSGGESAGGGRQGAAVDADNRLHVAGVSFQLQDGWENQAPQSSMRLAQIGFPGDEPSAAGVMTVMEARGGVQQNVDRWSGQFAGKPPAQTETRDIGGARVTVVRIEGEYHGMRRPGASGQSSPDSMLIGAIVEVPGRDSLLFFKGTGPKATMERWVESFNRCMSSIQVE